MKKFAKYGLLCAVVSLLGVVAGNRIGPPFMLLGGGVALLIRSFFPPLSLAKGLAAWVGGALMGSTIFGTAYLAYKFVPWTSPRLALGFLPAILLGAFLVYLSFRKGKKSPDKLAAKTTE